jgi:hypothetical protein
LQGSSFALLYQGFALAFDEPLHFWLLSGRSLRSFDVQLRNPA